MVLELTRGNHQENGIIVVTKGTQVVDIYKEDFNELVKAGNAISKTLEIVSLSPDPANDTGKDIKLETKETIQMMVVGENEVTSYLSDEIQATKLVDDKATIRDSKDSKDLLLQTNNLLIETLNVSGEYPKDQQAIKEQSQSVNVLDTLDQYATKAEDYVDEKLQSIGSGFKTGYKSILSAPITKQSKVLLDRFDSMADKAEDSVVQGFYSLGSNIKSGFDSLINKPQVEKEVLMFGF